MPFTTNESPPPSPDRRDPPRFAKPPVTRMGDVVASLFCIECGYNLRSLAVGTNCPECGAPVNKTLANIGYKKRCPRCRAACNLNDVRCWGCETDLLEAVTLQEWPDETPDQRWAERAQLARMQRDRTLLLCGVPFLYCLLGGAFQVGAALTVKQFPTTAFAILHGVGLLLFGALLARAFRRYSRFRGQERERLEGPDPTTPSRSHSPPP